MVGIPGKSKACLDCKRRRVKCDLTHPLCLRCSKAGIPCRGYEQSTLWVHRTPDQPDVTALSVVQQQQQPCESSNWLSLLQQMRTQIDSNETYDVQAFRLQAMSIAESIYFPQSRNMKSSEDHSSTPSSWLRAVCQLQSPSDALDHSLVAFCAIQIRLSNEPGISHDETIQLYNHALSKVIHFLDCYCVRRNDEGLAAILILSTCELFLFHASTSWNAHAQGISEILRHRAVPESNTTSWSDLGRRLCVICTIQALVQKRSLILETSIWRKHVGPPDAPESFGGLLDIAIDIPSLMAAAHALISNNESDPADSLQYISLLTNKFHDLEQWRSLCHQSTVAQRQIPLHWSVLSKASNPADYGHADKLFPFSLIFPSIDLASSWIFSSTVMLDVLDTILQLRENISDGTALLSLGDVGNGRPTRVDADLLARMLCQAVEYCYRSENGTFGPQITCYTQATLRTYFARHRLERELAWCRGIKDMKCRGTSFGIDLMQFKPGL